MPTTILNLYHPQKLMESQPSHLKGRSPHVTRMITLSRYFADHYHTKCPSLLAWTSVPNFYVVTMFTGCWYFTAKSNNQVYKRNLKKSVTPELLGLRWNCWRFHFDFCLFSVPGINHSSDICLWFNRSSRQRPAVFRLSRWQPWCKKCLPAWPSEPN